MKWEERRFDELGIIGRGKSKHRPRDAEHLYGGPYPFIQTGDVKHADLYINSYSQTYSEAGLSQSKLWPAGTLCITIAANIAETAILGLDACFPDSVIGFITDASKSDVRFLKYKFDTIKRQYQQVSQGAAQDNLSLEKLLSFKIKVPALQEQRAIADVLSAYDDLIENNRRRMALLEEAARLLYREWFVRLRFPGHERTHIVDGVPEGWERGRLSDFYETASGGTPSRANPDFFVGDIPWVKTQELLNGFVTDTEEKITEDALRMSAAKLFPEKTVLVAMYGATIGQLGIISSPAASNQACCAIMPRDARASFVHAFLFFRENKEKLVGFSMGAAQKNINQEIIRSFPMLMPPQRMMRLFNQTLNCAFDLLLNFQLQNQKLSAARDLLLPHLMSVDLMP
jgi:type I restriction enzyme S subunit